MFVCRFEIRARELARPIRGRLVVDSRPLSVEGEPISDLAAPPPTQDAELRILRREAEPYIKRVTPA